MFDHLELDGTLAVDLVGGGIGSVERDVTLEISLDTRSLSSFLPDLILLVTELVATGVT
jgi:hypothetical protein